MTVGRSPAEGAPQILLKPLAQRIEHRAEAVFPLAEIPADRAGVRHRHVGPFQTGQVPRWSTLWGRRRPPARCRPGSAPERTTAWRPMAYGSTTAMLSRVRPWSTLSTYFSGTVKNSRMAPSSCTPKTLKDVLQLVRPRRQATHSPQKQIRHDHDFVALLKTIRPRPGLFDRRAYFMPQDTGIAEKRLTAGQRENVRAADPQAEGFHQNLARSNLRDRDVHLFQHARVPGIQRLSS